MIDVILWVIGVIATASSIALLAWILTGMDHR